VNQPSGVLWTRLTLAFVALFGAAFSLTSLLIALPRPEAGGTCGPGRGSESAIVAVFDPITIGAGREPSAADAAARAQWSAFVQECQTAANDRAITAFPILVASAVLAIVGPVAIRRRDRREPEGVGDGDWWTPPRPDPYAQNPLPPGPFAAVDDPTAQRPDGASFLPGAPVASPE